MTNDEKIRVLALYMSNHGNVSKDHKDYAILDKLFNEFHEAFSKHRKTDTSPLKSEALQKANEAVVAYLFKDNSI